ncbi:MAG: hypothetical protein LBS26_00720 [Campylobacteraceae bacterium]|jgi:hypothetical protein|nr:hypothetical protein [Campylobacteraceae bacterium]
MQKMFKIFLTAAVIVFWVGCGGVEEEDGSSGGGGESGVLTSDCSGTYCGSNENNYAGSGIGVWRYKNSGSRNAALNVSLNNVANKDITIVFTNEGVSSVTLPYISVDTSLHNEMSMQNWGGGDYVDTFNYIPDAIREFNAREYLLKEVEPSQSIINYNQIFAKTWSLGEQNEWYVHKSSTVYEKRIATLKKQITVSGRTVNIWVENSEYGSGKMSDTIINSISGYLNTVISSVVSVAGEPWGQHSYTNLISAVQPLDIVLVNLKKDNQPFGTLGYFYALNNFLNSGTITSSNEALAVFVDTETIYLHSNGTLYAVSTIAHELTHAVHFYQRSVRIDDPFDTFLNEMSAIMMEDIVAKKIDSTFNDVKFRYIDWHEESDYRYDFADWSLSGDTNYDVAGSFGAFLMRQHGINFYKALFATRSSSGSTDHEKSLNILDKAIKSYNGEGLGRALQRWGASIAMFPSSSSPSGFGYPARNSDNGFTFEAFDGNSYKPYRKLPTYSPASLYAHAHFPFLRKTAGYTYSEQFIVPPKVSVSIVVK